MVTIGRPFLYRVAAALGAAVVLTASMTPAASASSSLDSITNAPPNVYGIACDIINASGVPGEISGVLNKGADSLTGGEEDEPGSSVPNRAPKTNQFLLLTVADRCIGGEGCSLGSATTAPGPTDLSLPGIPKNQFSSISTGLGTEQLAKERNTEMNAYWVDIANGKYGKTTLENNGVSTEEGPGVVSDTADTGRGLVTAIVQGGITTQEEPGPTNCNYTPTADVFPVGSD